MPTISVRGTEMPASPIRKLAPLADAAKQRGIHVYHLNIGQPDLPTPRAALDGVLSWNTAPVRDTAVIVRNWWGITKNTISILMPMISSSLREDRRPCFLPL